MNESVNRGSNPRVVNLEYIAVERVFPSFLLVEVAVCKYIKCDRFEIRVNDEHVHVVVVKEVEFCCYIDSS